MSTTTLITSKVDSQVPCLNFGDKTELITALRAYARLVRSQDQDTRTVFGRSGRTAVRRSEFLVMLD